MTAVHVIYHYEDGTWWADSPEVDRWSAAAPELDELVELVKEGVPFALERDDVEIRHVPAPDLMSVFAGKTGGTPVRVQLAQAFIGLLAAPEPAGFPDALLVG